MVAGLVEEHHARLNDTTGSDQQREAWVFVLMLIWYIIIMQINYHRYGTVTLCWLAAEP